MLIIGCDLHTRYQQIAMLDEATGELVEKRLEHESGEAHRFYRGLPKPVRVGIEATGPIEWRKWVPKSPLRLWQEEPVALRSFWQRRFYDFNVRSRRKKVEKIAYMHRNPVKRGLVTHPKEWPWSSYACYERRAEAPLAIDFVR